MPVFIKKCLSILKDYPIKDILFRLLEISKNAKKNSRIYNIQGAVSNYNIAIVLIIKNEARYIREWLEYHRIIGIEHFFIYDNASTDNLYQLLTPYIHNNLVTYHYCPDSCMQMPAYNDAIARYKKKSRWLAFIDADEFIVLSKHKSIVSFLKKYEKYSAIGVNWITFDSNNHITRPQEGFIISNYTRTYKNNNHPINRHIKTIVQSKFAKVCNNPHFVELRRGFYVNENFEKIHPPISNCNTTNEIQINHYHSKSIEEYNEKISRGRAVTNTKKTYKPSDYDFTEFPTKKSNVNLKEIVQTLKKIIPETYGPQYEIFHSNDHL